MLQCRGWYICYSVGDGVYATVWGMVYMLQCRGWCICYSVGDGIYATV